MLGSAVGCSSFSGSVAQAPPEGATAQQRKSWWDSNKRKAEFVPGKGYALKGVPGFFDDRGLPMQGGEGGGEILQASYRQFEDDKEGLGPSWLDNLNPQKNTKKVKESLGYGPDATKGRQAYQKAEALFQEKKYSKAAKQYAEAADRVPGSVMEEDSLFMKAESHFFADEYPKALDAYNELVKKHSRTRHLDKLVGRQFAMARYWEQHHQHDPHLATTPNFIDKTRHWFDTKGHALRAYENIRLNDPTGPLADDSVMATANLYFQSNRFIDADYYYGLLRNEYPESEHQYMAHVLGLQCKLQKYQGPDYDGTTLDEAEVLVKQLLTQFPDRVHTEGERKRVEKIRAEVTAARAQRDWHSAEFYVKKGQYGSARYYYTQIIDKHPSSKLALEAKSRLEEFADKPATPPQKMAWLVNLFPETDKMPQLAAGPGDDSATR
jgi:outer membrane protein assembly factor BamD (BamD/ComL family)